MDKMNFALALIQEMVAIKNPEFSFIALNIFGNVFADFMIGPQRYTLIYWKSHNYFNIVRDFETFKEETVVTVNSLREAIQWIQEQGGE